MDGPHLDRQARARQFIAALRRDCIWLGYERRQVGRWDVMTLVTRRQEGLHRMMSEAPKGTKCLD